jgi:hypothetical protein
VRIVPQKNTAGERKKREERREKEEQLHCFFLLLFSFFLLLSSVRVQRCGKSAPATSRGVGSVNPGRVQG